MIKPRVKALILCVNAQYVARVTGNEDIAFAFQFYRHVCKMYMYEEEE